MVLKNNGPRPWNIFLYNGPAIYVVPLKLFLASTTCALSATMFGCMSPDISFLQTSRKINTFLTLMLLLRAYHALVRASPIAEWSRAKFAIICPLFLIWLLYSFKFGFGHVRKLLKWHAVRQWFFLGFQWLGSKTDKQIPTRSAGLTLRLPTSEYFYKLSIIRTEAFFACLCRLLNF